MPRSDAGGSDPAGRSSAPAPDALAAWLAGQRWFAAKTRRIVGIDVVARIPLADAVLLIARVRIDDGREDHYALPLRPGGEPTDAVDGSGYVGALFRLLARGERASGGGAMLVGVPTAACPVPVDDPPVHRVGAEQSNTSVTVGSDVLLKHFRRLATGPHPEEEMSRFLTERARFAHAPRLLGHVEYRAADGTVATVAVAHERIHGAVDGWGFILDALTSVVAEGRDGRLAGGAETSLAALARLGRVTAALHRALASDVGDSAFAPEPIGPADVARWVDAVRRQLEAARSALGGTALPEPGNIAEGLGTLVGVVKIRHHGDYHLGQTLYRPASGEWLIIDFEGEPLRPLAERRQKHTALRDVAGMLRSIDYAAVAAARAAGRPPGSARGDADAAGVGRVWERAAAERFLNAYRHAADGARFVPTSGTALTRAVAALVVEKAAYEIVYEANNRPDWVGIPVEGLARAALAVNRERPAGAA